MYLLNFRIPQDRVLLLLQEVNMHMLFEVFFHVKNLIMASDQWRVRRIILVSHALEIASLWPNFLISPGSALGARLFITKRRLH